MSVCITGMHRSGTSMVAKLLHLSGIYLGTPADLIPASPDNQDGHWEHVKFVQLNDEILNELGAGWDSPPQADADWKRLLTVPRIRRKADALLEAFTDREPWGWKDPRASLTLPFWLELCPDLKVIICIRNPLEVAVSLKRRGLSSYAFGLRLWWLYNQRLLEHVAPARRLVTHYAAVLSRPQEELRRILTFLNISAAADIVEGASTSAREQLRHNRFTTRDLLSAEVVPEIVQLYLELCDAADWSEDVRGGALNTKRQPAAADGRPGTDDREWPDAAVLDATVVDVALWQRERNGLQSAIAAKDASIRGLESRLAEQQKTAGVERDALRRERDSLQSALAAGEMTIAARDATIADKDATIAERNATVAALDAAIVALLATVEEERDRLRAGQDELTRRDECIERLRTESRALTRTLDEARGRCERLEASVKREYEHLKHRLFDLIDKTIPRGATVLMVSRGDETLIRPNGRRTGHFPQALGGAWAGHYPADSAEAIAQLEALRATGGTFLVFPATARWWLEHYADFRTYLQTRCRTVVDREDTGIVFEVPDLVWRRRMTAVIARFEKRFARDPAILDWNSGLDLAAVFPHATVFAPPDAASSLPYLDRSVDIVVCPRTSGTVAEARRVASGMVVTIGRSRTSGKGRGLQGASLVSLQHQWIAESAPRRRGRARGSMQTGRRTGSAAVRSGSRQPRGQR